MNALARWRLAQGWTQQQAAQHCGVKQQAIDRAESGRVSVAMAKKIASRTDGAVKWNEIFGDAEDDSTAPSDLHAEGDDTDPEGSA